MRLIPCKDSFVLRANHFLYAGHVRIDFPKALPSLQNQKVVERKARLVGNFPLNIFLQNRIMKVFQEFLRLLERSAFSSVRALLVNFFQKRIFVFTESARKKIRWHKSEEKKRGKKNFQHHARRSKKFHINIINENENSFNSAQFSPSGKSSEITRAFIICGSKTFQLFRDFSCIPNMKIPPCSTCA